MTANRNSSYRGNPDFVDSDHKISHRKIKMTLTPFSSLLLMLSLLVVYTLLAAQEPFVIKDKRLLDASGPDPCHTDVEIRTSIDQGYRVKGRVEVLGGKSRMWCNGAKHTWIGKHENIEGAIATLESDKDDPLQFRVDKDRGYVYVKGKGSLVMPDGKSIKLPGP